MTDNQRAELAKRMVATLPKWGTWTYSFRDFETPYGKVGYRQLAILWIIRHELIPAGEISPGRLAAIYNVQPSVMIRALAKLEASGFVARSADARDARVSRLIITPKGREVSEYVEQFLDKEVLESMTELSDEQIEEVRRSVEILDRVVDDLQRKRVSRLNRRARRKSPDSPAEP